MSEQNVEVMRRMIEAFNRGDLIGALADFAPDAEWHTSGQFADQHVYRGHAGIEQLQAELSDELEGLSFSLSEVRAAGDKVFAATTLTGRGRRSGAEFQQRFWYAMTFRDRLIVRAVTYLDREQAADDVGLSDSGA